MLGMWQATQSIFLCVSVFEKTFFCTSWQSPHFCFISGAVTEVIQSGRPILC